LLTAAAHEAMVKIETAIEPTLAGDGELAPLTDWGGKYAGAIARIAGMLHLAELGPEKGPTAPVSAETILDAARVGAYFKACAINAFIEMGADQGTADAVYLLERIQRLRQNVLEGEPFEVSERELFTAASRGRFRTKDDLLPVLKRLVDHGYLIPLPAPKPTCGRPTSQRYRVVSAKAAEAAEGRR
jgi:replicative DNA helicase